MFLRLKEVIFGASENFNICPKVGYEEVPVTKKSEVQIPIKWFILNWDTRWATIFYTGCLMGMFTWPKDKFNWIEVILRNFTICPKIGVWGGTKKCEVRTHILSHQSFSRYWWNNKKIRAGGWGTQSYPKWHPLKGIAQKRLTIKIVCPYFGSRLVTLASIFFIGTLLEGF